MGLIDIDDVISLLTHHHFDNDKENFDLLIHNLCNEVKCIPIAYDVDAVVERLKCDDCERCSFCEVCAGNTHCGRCHERIIETVKGGGVNAID